MDFRRWFPSHPSSYLAPVRVIIMVLTVVILGQLVDVIENNWGANVAIQFTVSLATLSFFICETFLPRKIISYTFLLARSAFTFLVISFDIIRTTFQIISPDMNLYKCSKGTHASLDNDPEDDHHLENTCRFQLGANIASIIRGGFLIIEFYLVVRYSKIDKDLQQRPNRSIPSSVTTRQGQPPVQNNPSSHSIELPMEQVQTLEQSIASEDQSRNEPEPLPNGDTTQGIPSEEPPVYSVSGSGTGIMIDMTNISPADNPTEPVGRSSSRNEHENEADNART